MPIIETVNRRPGVPRLLRELNDRAAFDLLLADGPMTRTQLGSATGLSKVTAAQMLGRLEERGLVEQVGTQSGARGPNAALYAIVPSAGYVAGLEVGPRQVHAGIADITGTVRAEATVALDREDDPVRAVRRAIAVAGEQAGVGAAQLRAAVVGTPGVIDPRTGDLEFAFDLPAWRSGLRAGLTTELDCRVEIENDVNLVAVAEHTDGVARGVDDFALVWAERGVGLAMVIGGRLHRGHSGFAGEIGYLPVPGVPLASDVQRVPGQLPSVSGGLQHLVSEQAIGDLAGRHGASGETAAEWFATAGDDLLTEVAERYALGVTSVCVILDPSMVVLAGPVSQAGGDKLAERVEEAVGRISLVRPTVRSAGIPVSPALRGAVATAAARARELLFA